MRISWFAIAGAAIALSLAMACSAPASTQPPATGQGGNEQAGRTLFVSQCASCHVVESIPQARGQVGPNLTGYASQPQIAGVVPNDPANMARWLQNPGAVKPGTSMPNLGINAQQANDLTAFMATLR